MPATGTVTSMDGFGTLRKQLNGIASQFDQLDQRRLLQAVSDLLAALDYDDETLIDSSSNSLLAALSATAKDIIDGFLERSEATKSSLRDAWNEHVDGIVSDNLEEVRKAVELIIDGPLSAMTQLRDEIVKRLERVGHPVENADRLEAGILGLQKWRQGILQDWPSPSKMPSPLNQAALAEVRAALARGEKGLRKEELFKSCKKTSDNGG